MKNVIYKNEWYKDYGLFCHVYYVEVNYDFNYKTIDEIFEFIKEMPFCHVMLHTNDISHEIIGLIKKISLGRHIWLKSNKLTIEDILKMNDETLKILGFDKIKVFIGEDEKVIDLNKTLQEKKIFEFASEPPF